MKRRHTLLITRLSAIGDVALTVPLLQAALHRYPHLELVVLTRPFLHDLFGELPRVSLPALDLSGQHRGLPGLLRLARELTRDYPLDGMVDLHDVLRTQVLRHALAWQGLPVQHIRKDRRARHRLTRRRDKDRRPAQHSFALYTQALARAGFPLELSPAQAPTLSFARHPLPLDLQGLPRPFIGLAPFASHPTKMYPLERIAELAQQLASEENTVFLFGGPEDRAWFDPLSQTHPHILVAPIHPLASEMALIEQLDLMVSTDSANGHLARLVDTPVLTLWGPTHPAAGFHPLGPAQRRCDWQVSVDELPCRPCFVVKAQPCYRGDHACMQRLALPQLRQQIERLARRV